MSEAEACPITDLTKIMVAVDGSAENTKAITEALSLSKACNTILYAVSVVEQNPEYAALAPKAVEKADADARGYLDVAKARAEEEGVRCETVSVHGQDVAGLLVQQAQELDADMIVMGRHGRKKGLKKLLLGSTTSALISHAPCKVLVVP